MTGDALFFFSLGSGPSFRRKPESILISFLPWLRVRASTVLRPAGNSLLVIPAKAGIQFFLLPVRARASTVLRPAGNFLCWCKESHQRNTFQNLSRPRF